MLQALFVLFNLSVLPFWFLVVFLPGWGVTRRVIASPFIVLPFLVVYLALMLPALGDVVPLLLNPTLDQLAEMLGKPEGTLVAWVHFLAFDLFVGRWIFLDARDRGFSPLVTAPILLLTILLGPLGLLVYLLVRTRRPRPAGPDA